MNNGSMEGVMYVDIHITVDLNAFDLFYGNLVLMTNYILNAVYPLL